MLNEAQICLTGYVATQPVTRTVKDDTLTVSMRVAWTPRRRDRLTGEWVDGNTSYVTVICWRGLARNVAICLRKGDPIVVKGRLSVRAYEKDGLNRTAVEVEAYSVGHDLTRGVAQFERVRPRTGMSANEFAAARPGDADGAGGADGAEGTAVRQDVGPGSAKGAYRDGAGFDGAGFEGDDLGIARRGDAGPLDSGPGASISDAAGDGTSFGRPEDESFDDSSIVTARADEEPVAAPF